MIDSLTFASSQMNLHGKNQYDEYCAATPFPHIVIDNFLPVEIAQNLLEQFPEPSHPSLRKRFFFNQPGKYGSVDGHNLSHAPDFIQKTLFAFNSYNLLFFLQDLTGIKHLVADPYFYGGGLHQIVNGGKLIIHSDFNYEDNIKLWRRINLLLYLNKDWKPEYGGQLELWDKEAKHCVKSIEPIFNRCVIFNIHKNHFHGHPRPLNVPEGVTRKSIAVYYYTAEADPTDSEKHTTIWPKHIIEMQADKKP